MFNLAASFGEMIKRQLRKHNVKGKPMMKSVCVSMVKNEQDIIEIFIRHNSKFFDLLVILDNNSVDNTRDIVLKCCEEFDNVVCCDQPDNRYKQSEFMTSAVRSVQDVCFADFVCVLDADEFISAENKDLLWGELDSVPIGECALLPWKTYLPDPEADESVDAMKSMRYVRKSESPTYYKAVMRCGGNLDLSLRIEQGNHGFTVESWRGKPVSVKGHVVSDLHLMHFPLRSVAQMVAKGVVGWKANVANAQSKNHEGWASQWKKIHDLVCNGSEISRLGLALEACAYAQKIAPHDFNENAVLKSHGLNLLRKYSDGIYSDPFRVISLSENSLMASSSEILFERPHSLRRQESVVDTAFRDDWHWEHMYLDIPPFKFLVEKNHPKTVLDVGCGSGACLHLMKQLGVEKVFGVDGLPVTASLLGDDEYIVSDIQIPLDLQVKYDLVMCIEVVEHVAPKYTKVVLETINRHAKDLILFSMADIGQPGEAHINCKSIDEVISLWKELGWTPSFKETLAVRSLSSLSWLRHNVLVLRKIKADENVVNSDVEILKKIGAQSFVWQGQGAGVRSAAFKEDILSYGVGYVDRYL